MTAQHYSCDINITPSRKRKRQCKNFEEHKENSVQTTAASISCFTNDAFCSTPKKIVAKRRFQFNKNNESIKLPLSLGSEAKSISETNEHDTSKTSQNPFEVIRKPPKKKKRHTEKLACFENAALNLDFPEKLFNPYEVVRDLRGEKKSNCFSNPALNLKVHDASILCNPFEVHRQSPNPDSFNTKIKTSCKNPFVISPEVNIELKPKPCELKLGLPFTPKIGCRIDFKDVSISQLTPSKLLAETLVFSPVQKAKLSLDSIVEESSMDIGKELDLYQLELENSINEAKFKKTGATKESVTFSPPDSNCELNLYFKQKPKFTQKLYGIPENVDIKQIIEKDSKQNEIACDLNAKKEQNTIIFENSITESTSLQYNLIKQYQKTETAEVIAIENLDELYGCCADDKEESFDYKSAPFVRAYTRQETSSLAVSKESLQSSKSGKSDKNGNEVKKLLNVKNVIRKSIRKFVSTDQHGQLGKKTDNNPIKEPEHEKQKGFVNAIRSSFRRKSAKNPTEQSEIKNEISIIDCSERTMKLKTDALFSEYMNVEDLTKEKKPNLRSSIRKSTRDVRNQLLKSVFHKKHEEYDFRK